MTWVLLGAGLLLLAPPHPARRRLARLVGQRLPSPGLPRGSMSMRFSFRNKLIVGPLAGGLAGTVLAGVVPGLLAGLVVATIAWAAQRLSAERARSADQERLIALVSSIAAEQAAGAALATALRAVADDAGPWRPAVARAAGLAATGGDAARGLAHENKLVPIAVAVAVADRSGAALNDVLARVRAELVSRQAGQRAVAEAVAGPRSSAMLLSLLPLIGLAMGAALGARPWHVLMHTQGGMVALTFGVMLELAGVTWTIRLTG